MHYAWANRPYFHLRSKIWRHHRVPRPRFLKGRENLGNTAMVILHIFHCACAKRPYFHFRWKIWRHHHVSRPRFPLSREHFGDSRTFNAATGLLNICMGFQDLLVKNGGFVGQNRGRGGAILNPDELVLPFWGFYVCANFGENRSRNATARVLSDGQIHTLTDRQTDRRKPIL